MGGGVNQGERGTGSANARAERGFPAARLSTRLLMQRETGMKARDGVIFVPPPPHCHIVIS